MTNWQDPQTILRQSVIFSNVIHFFAGLYTWEIAINLSFEWTIVSRKRSFRWPMILYFACRYLMFFALVGVLVALNVTHRVNCQALYTFNQFAGNSAIGLASTLLMLRTIAVWNRLIYVVIPLVLISLGQWAILLHGMTTVVSSWNPSTNACVVSQSGSVFLDLIYFYTMSFDLIVLVMTTIGLYLSPGRSTLWKLIFADGLIYFVMASISNAFPAVLIALDLNPVMNIMFSVPAACTAAIFACRSFIRVSTYSTKDVYAYSSGPADAQVSTRIGNSQPFRARGHPSETFDSNNDLPYHRVFHGAHDARGTGTKLSDGGVHVLMETFSTADDKEIAAQDETPSPHSTENWRDVKNGQSFAPNA